jgi:membrane-bound metal-dependent hydrolase YbcI (DUF457 family)
VAGFTAILVIAGLWWQLTLTEIGICLAIALLGALWPDVDTKSFGQFVFYTLFFAFDIWLIYHHHYKAAAFLGLAIMLPILGKHRGFTHSRWSAFLIPALLYGLYVYYLGEFIPRTLVYLFSGWAGYFSHLLMDRR